MTSTVQQIGATECVSGCEARTVLLVGRVGNGKSATGNSILRGRAFLSKPSAVGVTRTSDLQTTVVDGQILNVIDTPGMLREPEMIRDEILNCFKMAKDGIHAVLVVLSIRSRCSGEETYAFANLVNLLEIVGGKVTDYMIVVFTGGDELDENDETLDDYLGCNCPPPFKEILEICGNRCILFDNKTRDSFKKSEQVKQLLTMVNEVVDKNAGKPYTDELLLKLKIKMNEVTLDLEQRLAKEKAARLEAERLAKVALVKSDEHTRLLRENLARTQREGEQLRNKTGNVGSLTLENLAKVPRVIEERIKSQTGGCAIL